MTAPPRFLLLSALLSVGVLIGSSAQAQAATTQAQAVTTQAQAVTTQAQAATVPAAATTQVTTTQATTPQATTPQVTAAPTDYSTLAAVLARLNDAPAVQQANLTLERAQHDLDAAQAAMNLTVTVGGNANYNSAPATGANKFTGTLYVKAVAGVLPWATARSALAAAQRALNYAKALRQESINSARLNAVQEYQNAYLAQLQVVAAQQNLKSAQQSLAAVQAQRAQQNATQESVLQAQSVQQSAQAAVLTAQNSLDTARRSLAATLGLGSMGLGSLDGVTFATPPVLPTTLDNAGLSAMGLGDVSTLVTRGVAASSDVVQDENYVADAQQALDDARRNHVLPALSIGATYGRNGSGPTAGFDLGAGTVYAGYNQAFGNSGTSTTNSLNVSLSGSYNIFDPATAAQLSSLQAKLTQTQLSLTVARQSAELAVRQQYSDTLTALGAVVAQTTLEERAKVALQSAQSRFAAGLATQNDVLSAQAAYAQAQQATQAARSSASLAIIKLQNLSGGPQ